MFKFIIPFLIFSLLNTFLYGESKNPFRLYIEAEECEGLLRYPYDNEKCNTWYAREANCRGYGAPGKKAVHHEPGPGRNHCVCRIGSGQSNGLAQSR